MISIKTILIWLWCFPQMIAGLILKELTNAELQEDGYYHYHIKNGSVTLGEYIFLCPAHYKNKRVKKHESGHRKQSLILGWLYLIVIGLPSFIWANYFENYRRKHNVSYYAFYTERWADKLGGIK